MAVRLRKLARELKRTPADVLGLLHAIGYPRYKSSEDMVADPVASKVRAAARTGLRVEPVEPAAKPKPKQRAPKGTGPGIMASLVPGVAPLGQLPAAAPTEATAIAEASLPSAPVSPPSAAPAPADDPLVVENRELHAVIDGLRVELEQAQAEALAARMEVERHEPEPAPMPPGTALGALLEARGLRGRDEQARAVEALIAARRLEPGGLLVADPNTVAAILRERLLLFDGDVPDGLGALVGVAVSADRADAPGAREIRRSLEKIGEQLLLCGWKKIHAVGVPPAWHSLLRNQMDSRIDLHLSPGGPRDAERAAADVDGMDVLWLWDVEGDDGANEAWNKAPLVVRGAGDLRTALAAVLDALASL